MTNLNNPGRGIGAALIAALVLLAGCAEKEVILPGVREDVRPELAEDAPTAPTTTGNRSRAIGLPGQRSNAEWPQSPGTQAYRTSNAALRVAPQRIWSVNIGEGDSRKLRITAAPVVGGGLVYALDSGARVSAVTPQGAVAWSVDLTPPADKPGEATGGGLAYAGGTLYVSTGFGELTALDARSGGVRWNQKLGATGSGAPLVSGNLVYLVAGDSTGWAVNTTDGRIVWQTEAPVSGSNVLGAPAPVLAGDLVVFAFGSGDIVGSFRRGGLRRWSASVAGRRKGSAAARIGDVTGAPVVSGSRIYAGNHSGRIVALNASTGDRIWTAREGALGPVWPVGDSIFAVSDLNYLLRIDAGDGSVIWSAGLPGFLKDKPRKRGPSYANYGPVLAGSRLAVASGDGLLRFFAPENGVMVASTSIPDGAATPPVVAGGTLYVVSRKGELHAFR